MIMDNFCKEFVKQSISATEYMLNHVMQRGLFLKRLQAIKIGIKHHIKECDTCRLVKDKDD